MQGIEIRELADGGDAVLVCEAQNRALPLPLFEDVEYAAGFLEFAEQHGIEDVCALDFAALDHLHGRWVAAGSPPVDDEEEEDEDEEDDGAPT